MNRAMKIFTAVALAILLLVVGYLGVAPSG